MCNILLAMAMPFQEIIVLPSHVQISVCSRPCVAMQYLLKDCKKIENPEYPGNFLSANSAIAPSSHQVAMQKFTKNCPCSYSLITRALVVS